MTSAQPIRVGIVTVSDRAGKGVYEDKGGPAIRATSLEQDLATARRPAGTFIAGARRERLLAGAVGLYDADAPTVRTTAGEGDPLTIGAISRSPNGIGMTGESINAFERPCLIFLNQIPQTQGIIPTDSGNLQFVVRIECHAGYRIDVATFNSIGAPSKEISGFSIPEPAMIIRAASE